MSSVVVTVLAGSGRLDLALPDDAPLERLLPEIADLLATDLERLRGLAPRGGKLLPGDRSLAECGVLSGAVLLLVEREPGRARPAGAGRPHPVPPEAGPRGDPQPVPGPAHGVPGRPQPAPVALVDLLVVGGPSAGLRVPLREGEHRVGSHRYSSVVLDDPTLSRIQLLVTVGAWGQVWVADAGSEAGSFLEGERLAGPRPVRHDQVVAAGRSLIGFAPAGSRPPALTEGGLGRERRWHLDAPPAGGLWRSRSAALAFRQAVAALDRELSSARSVEAARLRASTPDAVLVLDLARSTPPRPPRRRDAPDWLVLRVGWGDVSSGISVELAPGGDPALRKAAAPVLGRHGVLSAVPLPVSLADIGALGVAGEPDQVASLCRWLAVQLAALHAPEDLSLAVASADRDGWAWIDDLPHASRRPPPPAGPGPVREPAADLLSDLAALVQERGSARSAGGPAVVVFMDESAAPPVQVLRRLLLEGPAAGVHLVWVGAEARRAPGECGAVVEAPAGAEPPTLHLSRQGTRYRLGGLDGISARQAAEAARWLGGGGIAGPVPSRRLDLVEALALSPDLEGRVLENWIRDRSESAPRPLTSRLGLRLDGTPVEVDLRTSCPLLMAGAEGAGKSELLRCLVTSLAARRSPRTVRVALVDPRGGMEQCALLPHVARRVTGREDGAGARVLDWLREEVAWREAALRQEQSTSLDDLERTRPAAAPARLLVVADSVLELLTSAAAGELVEVARRGGRLGVHLVLTSAQGVQLASTFGPLGGSIVALRCASAGESEALIGTGDAYAAGLPTGRGFLATGSREVIEFQAPAASGPPLARLIEAIVAVSERLGPMDTGPGGSPHPR